MFLRKNEKLPLKRNDFVSDDSAVSFNFYILLILTDCELLHVDFKPVIWEVFGMPSDYFCDLFSSLARQISTLSKIDLSIIYSYWQKKFSFTLQLYNARLLINACMLILDKSANDFSRSDMNNCALEMSMFEQ